MVALLEEATESFEPGKPGTAKPESAGLHFQAHGLQRQTLERGSAKNQANDAAFVTKMLGSAKMIWAVACGAHRWELGEPSCTP